ncbi:PI-PLC X domain-containing protein 1 [Sarocladium implicatum]|nr:PI-PLC X domain-containing protein 1 [Sarocladium implicatum]
MRFSSLAAPLLFGLTTVNALPQQFEETQPQPTSDSSLSDSPSSPSSGTACNNHPDLCSRPYNQITYLGAHNSAFLRDDSTGHTISGNHFFNATLALDAGLRLLQAQVHDVEGELHLCHSSCSLLDAGPLDEWLAKIEPWVASHPNDVVTILLVNAASADAGDFAIAWESSGLAKHGFVPSTTEAPLATWPTLNEMISNNQRVVSFITRIDASPAAPYLLPEFSYVFETAFEVTELTGFNCSIDRPSRAGEDGATALQEGWLGLINHFKYESSLGGTLNFPDVDRIETVNDAGTTQPGNIGRQVDECAQAWAGGSGTQKPNFVLVDFWSEGDPLDAIDKLNGITDAETQGRSRANVRQLGPEGAKGKAGKTDLGHAALLTFVTFAFFLF